MLCQKKFRRQPKNFLLSDEVVFPILCLGVIHVLAKLWTKTNKSAA